MTQTMPDPPQPLETVDADVPCIQCGYNLRTLALASLCPECARPALESSDHYHAIGFTPAQRASLKAALKLLAISVSMTAGSLPLAIVVSLITGSSGAVTFILAGWIGVEHFLWAPVAVQLSIPDHRLERGTRWPRRHRWNVFLAVADIVALSCVLVVAFAIAGSAPDHTLVALALFAAACVFIARGGTVLLTGLWLNTLGRHLRFFALAKQIVILTSAFLVINAIWAICSLTFASNFPPDASLEIATFTAIPTLLLFAPWAAIVLIRFAVRFGKLPVVEPSP